MTLRAKATPPFRSALFALSAASVLASAGCASSEAGADLDDTPSAAANDSEPGNGSGDDSANGSGRTDPEATSCAEETYTEALPTSTSLAGSTFSPLKANDYLLAALGKRYPLGKAIVEGGLASSLSKTQGNCIDRFLSDRSTAAKVLRQASTVVHECGHFYDLGGSSGNTSSYVLRTDLTFACSAGDTTSRNGKTFARSLIRKDAYYAKRKACASGTAAAGCDMYAEIYLNGNPTDAKFESGDQGYNFVLEEAAQYVNSLATALAFEDQLGSQRVSERDGILTFLWYIERYLAMARADYPAAYELISGDPCWRAATLSVWDRGWFYLRATEGKSSLGIEDSAIAALVADADLSAEIDALRELECK